LTPMQEEKLEVVRANESFYRAFESLDIKEMEKVITTAIRH